MEITVDKRYCKSYRHGNNIVQCRILFSMTNAYGIFCDVIKCMQNGCRRAMTNVYRTSSLKGHSPTMFYYKPIEITKKIAVSYLAKMWWRL